MTATVISMEEALKQVGGFGKQQWINLAALAIVRQSMNIFIYCFPYWIYPQKYNCRDEQGAMVSCDLAYVCSEYQQNRFVDYEIDKSFVWYFWNWYAELRWIECTNVDVTVQAMASLYFLTNGISGMYVGWMPDFYGRKTTILYSLGASLLVQAVFMFNQSHMMRYICFFLLALCNVKNGCAYVWAFEMAGAPNKVFVTTIMNAFDRVTLFVMAFTMLVVARWWLVVVMFYWTLGLIAWCVVYFKIPESPLWHVMNSRNDEAIDVLN